MSVSYWMIEGIGLNADEVYPFVDKEKLAHMLIEYLPDDEFLAEILESKDYEKLDIEDYLYDPFDGFADILTHCDDSDTITFAGDGDGNFYFYYSPSMPWEMTLHEPQSPKDVHNRIIKAVKKITTLSDEEIEAMIDDELYVLGAG